jgi:hypothetical protein
MTIAKLKSYQQMLENDLNLLFLAEQKNKYLSAEKGSIFIQYKFNQNNKD